MPKTYPFLTSVDRQRVVWKYYNEYDVALIGAFGPEERSEEALPLYEKIDELVTELGGNMFMPHRDIDEEWTHEKTYRIVNEIVIPTAEVCVAYVGIPSFAGGIMLQRARSESRPIIYLHEKDRDCLDKIPEGGLGAVSYITFDSIDDALGQLRPLIVRLNA